MTLGRTLLLGAGLSAAIATLTPTAAPAYWREPGDAFSRLACWYAFGNPNYAPPPGSTFGYGGPSCWDRTTIVRTRHLRARAVRVRG